MKQKKLITLAISGVRVKRNKIWDGYLKLKETNPEAAKALMAVAVELAGTEEELEKMLKEEENGES